MEHSHSFEEVYETLQREIIDLTIKPGSLLSEHPLCDRFGATRTLVRGVLQRLQENGLVRIVPYKGTTVTLLNFDIVNQLIYERVAVESMVLRDFAKSCDADSIALVRRRLARYAAETAAPVPNMNRLYDLDKRLHQTWFSAMRKMYLWETLQNSHADYSRFRMLDTVEAGDLSDVVHEHEQMLAILENKNYESIEPLMEHHLYGGIRRLGSKLTTDFNDYFMQPGQAK